MYNQI